MFTMEDALSDDGWRQVKSGVALIVWSRLAKLEISTLRLEAVDEQLYEYDAAGHRDIHHEYGRLISWLTFSVGAEYLVKGTSLLRGKDLSTTTTVIRPPEWDEPLDNWIAKVNSSDSGIKVADKSLRELGKVPVCEIAGLGDTQDMVSAAIHFLRSTIRNRDAHRYAPNQRAAHFKAVPRLFVPAFNALLGCLDATVLRGHIANDA